MDKRVIRVGSRDSRLAVDQTMLLLRAAEACHPELSFELVTMKTTGDLILDRPLDQVGGKGLFVRELDRALAEKRVDITVHSLKDLPMEQPEGLPLVAFARRGDPRDALVYPAGKPAPDLTKGGVIGTSSARRALQLKRLFPLAEFRLLRGNVQTRLRKLDEGEYDAIVLAASGLIRLGLEARIGRYLTPEEMIPAAGQGILAVQGRAGADDAWLECIRDADAAAAALAERGFVRALDGGCSSPIAAYAEVTGQTLRLRGLNSTPDGARYCIGEETGLCCEAEQVGRRLAERLKLELEQVKAHE